MKTLGRLSFVLTGLLLLPWPIFVVLALLVSDPFHPRTVRDLMYAAEWFAMASYPLIWVFAWATWLSTPHRRLMPLLIAMPYVVLAAMFLLDFAAHHLLSGSLLRRPI